jgi:hypothetical protein
MNQQLWAIPESKGVQGLASQINYSQAKDYNQKGFGIFHTVNCFKKNRRTEEVTKLSSFYVDLDGGDKDNQIKMIKQCPTPSLVVESKNGFHVYWKIRNNMIKDYGLDIAIDNYKLIQEMIVKILKGDPKAKDVPRLLRTPGFYHKKSDDFLVEIVSKTDREYNSRDFFELFKPYYKPNTSKPNTLKSNTLVTVNNSDDFWSKVASMDVCHALSRLSGTSYVNQECFEIKNNYNDTKQIWVNGKSTGNWIDTEGKIAGKDNNIGGWLYYYLKDWSLVASALKDVFPELNNNNIKIFGE